jgi:hypothetical protein
MKRVIVDYAKLTNEILNLLVEKFPDGYDDSKIVRFRNAKNELIEAVEVGTNDTVYLVKVSMKLADRIENYDEDEEIDDVIEPIMPMKSMGLDDDMDDEDEEHNRDQSYPDDDEDSDKSDYSEDDEEDDEDGE